VRRVVDLADRDATFSFYRGQELIWDHRGRLRLPTRLEHAWMQVTRLTRRWTRWFRPRNVVTAIDREAGSVTIETERWSWRRWRWERAA
jgi:hypothetical protein